MDNQLDLCSNVIRRKLQINCAVLMGANIAPEVSIECFCEATIGESGVLVFLGLNQNLLLELYNEPILGIFTNQFMLHLVKLSGYEFLSS